MGSQEYECPACGGIMEFDAPSQKLKCLYCDTKMTVEEYKTMLSKKEAEKANTAASAPQTSENGENPAKLSEEEAAQAGFGADKAVYVCQSCGGEIIADKNQGAASCPFCGNNVTFKEVFTKGRRPDYVIPFQLTKEQAKARYKEYVSKKKLLPNLFTNENHIDEIKGVYIPYWLFDGNAQVTMNCEATKTRHWSDRDYSYTETSYYDVYREGEVSFARVPVDGSTKMPDDLTESIEPFDPAGLTAYDDAYLAGFVANQYDVDAEAACRRAQERMTNSAVSDVRNTIQGYSNVMIQSKNSSIGGQRNQYALYPVWLLSTTWKGEHFLFAMNGQTGRFVGNLPIDKGKAVRYYAAFAAMFTVVAFILEMIFRI